MLLGAIVRAKADIWCKEVLETTAELAKTLINKGSFPAKAEIDAFHVAVASTHGVEFLLTWNCKHIANAIMSQVGCAVRTKWWRFSTNVNYIVRLVGRMFCYWCARRTLH